MEASTVEVNLEKRVVKLARDVSDAVDSVIPRLLLQIQGAYSHYCLLLKCTIVFIYCMRKWRTILTVSVVAVIFHSKKAPV